MKRPLGIGDAPIGVFSFLYIVSWPVCRRLGFKYARVESTLSFSLDILPQITRYY